MNRLIPFLVVLILTSLILAGCGSKFSPSEPEIKHPTSEITQQKRLNLGYYQFYIDPDNETLSFTPLRTTSFHLNALPFLEPPAGLNLSIDKIVGFEPGKITVDIKLTHPYQSNFFTGFDVCGILISYGTVTYPLFTHLNFPGPDVVRLLNPDGLIRWWNPVEFPVNPGAPHRGYKDGLMGTPDSKGDFTAKLNGYKYFATELTDPTWGLEKLDPKNRGVLRAGTSCVRRYEIGFVPGNLVFNYAIDANWAPPKVKPPTNIPDDFPLEANRAEAYRVEIHDMVNTLTWNEAKQEASGMLSMSVYVFDWQAASDNNVCAYSQHAEIQDNCGFIPSGGDDTYSFYAFDLPPQNLKSADDFLLWVAVDSHTYGYEGFAEWELQAVYFPMMIPVKAE